MGFFKPLFSIGAALANIAERTITSLSPANLKQTLTNVFSGDISDRLVSIVQVENDMRRETRLKLQDAFGSQPISTDIHRPTLWNLTRKFLYTVALTGVDPDSGDFFTKFHSISSYTKMSPDELIQLATEQSENPQTGATIPMLVDYGELWDAQFIDDNRLMELLS